MQASTVLVDYIPGIERQIAATLATYVGTDAAAGLGQDDAAQLVTGLALLRTNVSMPSGGGQFAIYDKEGALVRSGYVTGEELADMFKGGEQMAIGIVGANVLEPPPAGAGLPADWGKQLALAIDATIEEVSNAKTSGTPQGAVISVGLALPALALIVAGVGAAVVGTAAAWRYLSPEARTHIRAVEEAAQAYRARLDIYAQTGQMPPASELEKGNAKAIAELAKGRSKNRWMWAVGAVGGLTVGTVGLAWVRKAMA